MKDTYSTADHILAVLSLEPVMILSLVSFVTVIQRTSIEWPGKVHLSL